MSSELVKRVRLRNGIRTIGIEGGQFITEPTYAEYVLAEDYDRLSLALTEAQAKLVEAERDAGRWKYTADELVKNVEFLREKEIAANFALERECADGDRLLKAIGLSVEQYRTEGGLLNVPKIVTAISEQKVDRAIAERIDAALSSARREKP